MLYVIDNYDSFTHNLVQLLRELGRPPRVVLNDETTVETLTREKPDGFVLSPGPGGPGDAGICLDVIRHFSGVVPILGVCLGHQAIVQAFGGAVVPAREVAHGKASDVEHDGTGVFRGIPSPLRAGRYHSLVVEGTTLPPDLVVTAFTRNAAGAVDTIMGVRHVAWPIEGVQFHPESILTSHGRALMSNFCDILTAWAKRSDATRGAVAGPSGGASSAAGT